MKTYQEFRYSLIESDIRGWDSSLIEKMEEWINLDEETQIKIVNGFIEGDESLIEEWGMLDEKSNIFKGFGKKFMGKGGGFSRPLRRAALKAGLAKKVAKFIPGVGTALYGAQAIGRAARGDFKGAALAAGSAIPGPVGYGFIAADMLRGEPKPKPKQSTPNQKTNTPPPNINNKPTQNNKPIQRTPNPNYGNSRKGRVITGLPTKMGISA
tara:strand:- start:1500 stop:2132 length:633 start_codon:yes stop_codon:yes gene_type:complete